MKDALKIALGVFLGVLAILACLACGFIILSVGGAAMLSSYITPLPTAENFSTAIDLFAATPTPVVTPTPIVPIFIGEWAQWDGLSLSVKEYQTTQACPGNYGQPAAGAKFVIAQVTARNASTDVIDMPSLKIQLNSYESGLGASLDCRYDQEAFGNACWQWSGKLYPDVICEGWVLFEVPADMSLQNAIIRIQEQSIPSEPIHISEWQLEGD